MVITGAGVSTESGIPGNKFHQFCSHKKLSMYTQIPLQVSKILPDKILILCSHLRISSHLPACF